MMDSYAPIARIALRYLTGLMVGAGMLDDETAAFLSMDPDVVQLAAFGIAALAGLAVEFWYWVSKRRGGAT